MDSPVQFKPAMTDDQSEDEGPAVNPAPPPDAAVAGLGDVLHSDAIGDTLYSERGVLRTLMALNAAVPRYLGLEAEAADGAGNGAEEAGDVAGDGEGSATVRNTGDGGEDGVRDAGDGVRVAGSDGGERMEAVVSAEDGSGTDRGRQTVAGGGGGPTDGEPGCEEPPLMELDSELEQQLCDLWDMSAERAVAEFAAGSGLLEVAWPLLDRSPCPRLLEILAGTLANCAGHGVSALPGGADTAASAVALLIANSRGDAPVLRETLRLAQAALCALPEPEPLLRALSGWLPLLTDVLRGALSAPLLRQTLGLLAAVAQLPGRRRWWLAELAALEGLSEAVLEGLAQLVTGGRAGVTADDALDCCRDALLLLAEVEAVEGAARPASGQSVGRRRDGWRGGFSLGRGFSLARVFRHMELIRSLHSFSHVSQDMKCNERLLRQRSFGSFK